MALIKKTVLNLYARLPTTSGVYQFLDSQHLPIYIGKAVNLRARVKQHFTDNKNRKEQLITKQTIYIKIIQTDSELKALLLEANLIRQYQPKYNAVLLDDKSRLYILITKETYPKVRLVRQRDLSFSKESKLVFGPFISREMARQLLRKIRRAIPFCTEKNLSSKPCFYSHLGLCSPCPNWIESQPLEAKKTLIKQYQRNIRRLIKLLRGRGEKVLAEFEKELLTLSKQERYEEASALRDRWLYLQALFSKQLILEDQLSDLNQRQYWQKQQVDDLRSLLKLSKLKRIEGYDISNLNFKEATASMVVFIDGEAHSDQYRRFKIKGKTRFDPEMLIETLKRRFKHPKWSKPDLIVIDGGLPQLNLLALALKAKNNLPLMVGLAKRPDRLVLLTEKQPLSLEAHPQALLLLQRVRDEAHRFAKKYHLYLRHKALSKMLGKVQ